MHNPNFSNMRTVLLLTVASSSLNSSQLTVWKLWVGVADTSSTGNYKMVSIGTWSIPGPLSWGAVEQLTISNSECSEQKMLSGHVQFFVAMASRVGISLGSTMTIPWSATIPSNSSDSLSAAMVNRCLLHSLSQSGWWRLKLPHQNMWLEDPELVVALWVWR